MIAFIVRVLFVYATLIFLWKFREKEISKKSLIIAVAAAAAFMIASFVLDYSVLFVKTDYFSTSYFVLGGVLCALDAVVPYIAVFAVAKVFGYRYKCYVPDISLAIASLIAFLYMFFYLKGFAEAINNLGFYDVLLYGSGSALLYKLIVYITNNAPGVILGISFVVNEKRALKKAEEEK
jgi:hypothetical protein